MPPPNDLPVPTGLPSKQQGKAAAKIQSKHRQKAAKKMVGGIREEVKQIAGDALGNKIKVYVREPYLSYEPCVCSEACVL